MAVRQEDVNSAMLSILKKMDKMVQASAESYNNQNTILTSIEKTFKVEVSVELKKQTKLLTSINSSFLKEEKRSEASVFDFFKRKSSEDRWKDSVLRNLEHHTRLLILIKNKESGGKGSTNFNIQTNLDKVLLALPEALLKLLKVVGTAFLLGPILEEGALVLTKVLKTLLNFSKDVKISTALKSVVFIAVLEASKLRDLLKLFKEVGGIFSIFTLGDIDGGAKRISRAITHLLSIGLPTKENPKGLNVVDAVFSSFAINLLANAPLKNLIDALADPIDFWSLIGVEKGTKATKAMVDSIRGLLKISEGIRWQDVLWSVLAIKYLAESPIGDLINALKPGFFATMFSASGGGAKIQRRAEGFAGAIRSLLLVSEGIEPETIISSIVSIGILAYSVDVLISAMKSAAIWNPLLIIGVKITRKIINTLVGGMSEVLKDGENLVYAGIYLVLLSFSLGTIMTMTVVAALLAPLVMIGGLVIRFTINQLLSIKRSVDKENLDQAVITKFETLGLIVSAVIGAIALLIALDNKAPLTDVLIKIGFFLVISNVLTFTTLFLSKKLSTAKQGDFDKFALMATGITNMMNAISIVILSKALENPAESFKRVIMFVVLFAAISFSTMYTVSLLTKTKKGNFDSLALLSTGITNILNAIAVVILSKALENPPDSFAKVFMFILIFGALVLTTSLAVKQIQNVKFHSIIAFGVLVISMVATVALVILFMNAYGTGSIQNIIMFSLLLGAIAYAASFFSKKLGTKNAFNQILKASLAIVIFSTAITLVALMINNFVSMVDPLSVLSLLVTISAISYIAMHIGKKEKDIMKGAKAFGAISLSLTLFIAPLYLFAKSGFGLMEALSLGLILLGVTGVFFLAGKKEKDIKSGALALGLAGLALIPISFSLSIFAKSGFSIENSIALSLSLIGMAYGFALAGKKWKDVLKGALALSIAGLALFAITPSLMNFAKSGFSIENSIALSISLIGMAFGFALAGKMWVNVLKGALALSIAGLALFAITPGLAVFAMSGFGIMSALSLTLVLLGMSVGFGFAGIMWKSIMKGALALTIAGISLLLITPGLAVFAISGFDPMSALSLTLVLIGMSIGFGFAGMMWKSIMKGSIALIIAGISLLLITPGLAVFAMSGFGIMNALSLTVALIGISIGFGLAGMMWTSIIKGAIALTIAGLSLWLITPPLVLFAKSGFTIMDGLTLAGTLGLIAVVFGLTGVFFAPVALGAVALGLSAIAIWLMTYALKEFQSLNWTEKDSDKLTYTIKSVLGALSGTSDKKGIMDNITGAVGQGLQAIMALLSAGPLLVGSAAIWLMSVALEKFQSINWGSSDNEHLALTISAVLGALSGSAPNIPKANVATRMLDTIIAFMGAGALVVGSAAIWLMSEALIKFKTVGWDKTQNSVLGDTISLLLGTLSGSSPSGAGAASGKRDILDIIISLMSAGVLVFAAASIWLLSEALLKFKSVKWTANDTKQLSFTMNEILSVMTGAEKDGGLFGAITGAAKSLIGSVGSAGNATSLGLASLSIIKLSDALLKWKNLGWDKNQTSNLRNAIDQILLAFKSSTPDGLESVADNFDKIQNSMKLLKGHINDMDLKKLTLTDSMMRSIAMLSKSPEAIGQKIAESIDKAFEDLAKAIAESIGEIKSEGGGAAGAVETTAAPAKGSPAPGAPAKGSPAPPQGKMPTASEIGNAVSNALLASTLKVRVVTP